VAAGAAYLVKAEAAHGWLMAVLVAASGSAASLAAVLPTRVAQERSRRLEDEERRRQSAESATENAESDIASYRAIINRVLLPIVGRLDKVINSPKSGARDELKDEMLNVVLESIAENLGGRDRTRTCYFKYSYGPPRRLVRHAYRGRDDQPREQFVEGTPDGDYVCRLLTNRRVALYPDDHEQDKPPIRPGTEYKTFITATVASRDVICGMLGVDSTDVGDLTEQDRKFVAIVAQILGTALAVGARQATN
jgi:hypothetical protein